MREYFQFAGMKHPSGAAPQDVLLRRDRLRPLKGSAAAIAFKLSAARPFFEYLKAAATVPLNPASTELVRPPELPPGPAGRALSAKGARYPLSGPDREKARGKRLRADAGGAQAQPTHLGGPPLKGVPHRAEPRPPDATVRGRGAGRGFWPLPKDVKGATGHYPRPGRRRREVVRSGGGQAPLFQPHTNRRTLGFDEAP